MTATAEEAPGFADAGEVARLVERFENRTLPKAEWTHAAHLAVGLWYASRLPFERALAAVREGIQGVNAVHGVVTTPTGGYHETITRFYMRVICEFVASEGPETGEDWADRVHRLLRRYGAKDLPLRYYTRERLMSADARAGWVEPDLRPISSDAIQA